MRQGFKRMINSPIFPLLLLTPTIKIAARSTNPVMKTVFHAGSYNRFTKPTSNLRRKIS